MNPCLKPNSYVIVIYRLMIIWICISFLRFHYFLQSCSNVLTNLLNTGMHISLLSMFKTVFRENKHGKIANCWWSNNFVLDRIQNIKGFLDMGKLSKAIWNNAVLLYCSTVIIFIDRWFNKGQQYLKCNS